MRIKILTLFWALTDALIAIVAYAMAFAVVRPEAAPEEYHIYIFRAVTALPFWMLLLYLWKAYSLRLHQRSHEAVFIIATSHLAMLGIQLVLIADQYSQAELMRLFAWTFVIGTAAVWFWHMLYAIILRWFLRRNPPVFPTIVVGSNLCATDVIHMLETESPLKVVGILESDSANKRGVSGIPVLGKLNALEGILQKHRITHVVHCTNLEQSVNVQELCERYSVTYVLPSCAIGIRSHNEHTLMLRGRILTEEGARKWV